MLSTFAPIFSGSKSESDDSESDFNSVVINLDICVFLPQIYTFLNKLADDFFLLKFIRGSIVIRKYNAYFLLAYHYPKGLFLLHH